MLDIWRWKVVGYLKEEEIKKGGVEASTAVRQGWKATRWLTTVGSSLTFTMPSFPLLSLLICMSDVLLYVLLLFFNQFLLFWHLT